MKQHRMFLILSFCFGLIPSSRISGTVWQRIFAYVPMMSLLVLHFICLSGLIYQDRKDINVSMIVNWMQFVPNSGSYILWIANMFLLGRLYGEMLNNFDIIDSMISDTFRSKDMLTEKFKKSTVLLPLGSWFLACSFGTTGFFSRVDFEELWTFFYWLGFTLPKLSLYFVSLQCYAFTSFLAERILILDNTLAKTFTSGRGLQSLVSYNEKLFRKVTNPAPDIAPTPIEDNAASSLLRLVEQVQFSFEMIMKYFGRQILANLLPAFITLTVQLYYLILTVKSGGEFEGLELVWSTACLMITIHFSEFLLLIRAGTQVNSNWSSLKMTILSVLLNVDSTPARRSLKIAVEKMTEERLELNASNVLTVDSKLFMGAISTISTYLLVLVQFSTSEDGNSLSQKTFAGV